VLPDLDFFHHGRNSRLIIWQICVLFPVSRFAYTQVSACTSLVLLRWVSVFLLASLQIVLLYSLVYSCMTLL
jgi:hypothetical protein